MRIVIDCNVFVSAVLGSKVCRQVIKRALLYCQIFYSKATLIELESVLKRPNFKAFQDAGNEIINALKTLGVRVDPQSCPVRLPDPDDEIYLAVALHVEADLIITGNTKHFPQKTCGSTRILTPRDFLNTT